MYDFLFHSGFSTTDQVSDISGRGVGLDAVRNTIQSLGGTVTVQSTPGQGSTFLICLPLTVSILSAMLVRVGQETFAIPINAIVHMDRLHANDINTSQGNRLWDKRDKLTPLVFLRDLLRVPDAHIDAAVNIAVLSKGDKLLAVAVDGFIGQHEVVLKSLGKYLAGTTHGISVATILGD